MWRVTVGAHYEIRKRGKKKNRKGDSPDKAAYMVRGWYETHARAIRATKDLEERAVEGRSNYQDENPRAFHRDEDDEVNVAIQTVDYDERLLGMVEELNEK